jgi:endothelin-converting enzyme
LQVDAWRGASLFTDDNDEAISDHSFLLQSDADVSSHHRKDRSPPKKPSRRWDPKTKRTRLTNALTLLHSRSITAFFEAFTEGDTGGDPSQVVLWISQSGLGLPSKDYYKDKKATEVYQSVVAEVLKRVYGARGESIDGKDLAESVLRLEKQIAAASLDAFVSSLFLSSSSLRG